MLYILILIYLLIIIFSFRTKEISRYFINKLAKVSIDDKMIGFWSAYDAIERRRKIIILLLFGFSFLIIIFTLLVLFVSFEFFQGSNGVLHLFLLLLMFILLYYLMSYLDNLALRKRLKHFQHSRREELKKLIKNISITAGITKPDIDIDSSSVPYAYTLYSKSENSYIITVSVGMLNSLTRVELEAVLAHEISHIISGQVVDYQTIRILLNYLKLISLSFIIFILYYFRAFYLVSAEVFILFVVMLVNYYKTDVKIVQAKVTGRVFYAFFYANSCSVGFYFLFNLLRIWLCRRFLYRSSCYFTNKIP